ncbi:MAG: carbohydrate-binding protein, partial [Cytophagales bacterium]|nr:carbohydrate-binding protein [Cytophagales bacterium]
KNARLVRIDYNENNRVPVAKARASKTAGAVPLTVAFSGKGSYDYDKGDALTYQWTFDPAGAKATGMSTQYTFTKPGTYRVQLQVTDSQGQRSTDALEIRAGNDMPQLDVVLAGNQTFYWPGKPVQYQVKVRDREDGSLADGRIAPDSVAVTLERADMGTDLTFLAQNHEKTAGNYFHPGLELINKSDCRSCHHPEEKSVGPSYRQVAQRYRQDAGAVEALAAKIIKGGNGNWGETAMSAHPQLKREETTEIVKYILSLGTEPETENRVTVKGSFTPESEGEGHYIFAVTYRDKGGKEVGPQTAKKYVRLRNARLKAVSCDDYRDVAKFNNQIVKFTASGAYILFKDVDLTGLGKVTGLVSSPFPARLELRAGTPNGPLLGSLATGPTATTQKKPDATAVAAGWQEVRMDLKPAPSPGRQDVYVVFKETGKPAASMWSTFDLDWLYFQKAGK